MKTIRVRFIFDREDYLNDVQEIPRAFSPYLVIDNEAEGFLSLKYSYEEGIFNLTVESSFAKSLSKSIPVDESDKLAYKKQSKTFIKNILYDYISTSLGIELPYGSLTGVRPTKLFRELQEAKGNALDTLINDYRVSANKANLIKTVVMNQECLYQKDKNLRDIFVNIPICPSRCNYCSFISSRLSHVKNLLASYVECVRRELERINQYISKDNLSVRSIYVGGGTPTCIGEEYLNAILSSLKDYNCEFTVEAGRPDAIDDDILRCMRQNNVTRISVNPQSMNRKTLKKIGRNHTVEDVYKAVEKAKRQGFIINMDIIALLEDETLTDFENTVEKVLALDTENITVHTLSIKRGAEISDQIRSEFGLASKMVDYAHKRLMASGYRPYYMYRQKNIADNLENTGFAKPSKECIYNIDVMEESIGILGAGAGAMSKFLYDSNRIERAYNPKGIKEYIKRIDEVVAKKNFC
ncbi:MAG: coproporphyrinogen dehydrogenase HemZ [Bacillota bacterium]|jgi:coproporphyrinogen dehydrogenase HemZ|nr:coproporphyrinogen dehydrogenase HemZ [Bacillota bacterium]HHU43637.1 coproporphyrinogen dehydrogenase HemZ [Clostridiales bacterium]